MRSASIFRRVTKYRESGDSTPAENRLTEAFAVLLQEVDGLALRLAKKWLESDDDDSGGPPWAAALAAMEAVEGDLTVETQWPTTSDNGPGIVDLELRFNRLDRGESIVRVEIKHGADLAPGQLSRYQEDRVAAVVLLAPVRDMSDRPSLSDEVPDDVPKRSWQATAREIRYFTNDEKLSEKNEWLIGQFLQFLREEGLMSISRINDEHFTAMGLHGATTAALAEVLEFAELRVAAPDGWGEKTGGEPSKDYGFVRRYKTYRAGVSDQSGWPKGWFEFKASTEDLWDDREQLHFIAGVSWKKGDEFSTGMQTDPAFDFERFTEDSYVRYMRVATPKDVLVGETLEEQGNALGDWIVETFEALSPPGRA